MFKVIDNNMNAQRWQDPCFESANESMVNPDAEIHTKVGDYKRSEVNWAYEEAFVKGYKDGMEQGKYVIKNKASCFLSLMNTMKRPLEELDKNVVDELVELSMIVVRHMVKRELKASRIDSTVENRINAALAVVMGSECQQNLIRDSDKNA